MNKITKIKRIEQGVCIRCAGELDTDGKMCIKCREKLNESEKQYREFYLSNGICPRCRKEKIFGSERSCPECRAKQAEISRKNHERHREEHNETFRKYSKALYENRKANGICPKCGKHSAKKEGVFCEWCLAKNRKWLRKARERKGIVIPRSERVSYGLCYICGNPIDDNRRVCLNCRDMLTNNLSENRGGGEHWKRDNEIIFRKDKYE